MADEVKVFVGCGSEHWLPVKVLEFSIRRRTQRPVRIRRLDTVPVAVPIPRDPAQRPVTSFSFQRFLIPEACDFKGKGIYLDSDQIVMADIGELWDSPIPAGAAAINTGGWQTAVMLIDCACGWRIADFVNNLDSGRWRYAKMMNCQYPEMGLRNGIAPLWNATDREPDPESMNVAGAKLLHYTLMNLQPWLTSKHPHGRVWELELKAAIAAGFVTVDDVLREIRNQNVRPSLALLVDEEPPYDDAQFVFPDLRRKGAA